jgi:hypothetical protein
MGGELGILIIYFVGVIAPALCMLVVLLWHSRNPMQYPHARLALLFCVLTSALFCAFGAYWWYNNFPDHLTWNYFLFFCVIPGFVLGGCFYGIIVKAHRGIRGIINKNAT